MFNKKPSEKEGFLKQSNYGFNDSDEIHHKTVRFCVFHIHIFLLLIFHNNF